MSKRANAGELRTRILIKRRVISLNDNGFETETFENVYGDGHCVFCKWVGNHGSEVFSSDRYTERRTATVTMRYSPLAEDSRCVVFRDGDPVPWEIVNADNVEGRNQWLELSLMQKVPAR
jgi:head-tail adaptor